MSMTSYVITSRLETGKEMMHGMDIAGYLSKVADFDPPNLHLAPLYGVTPVEFRGDLWLQKTRVLECGVVYVILRLAVLV